MTDRETVLLAYLSAAVTEIERLNDVLARVSKEADRYQKRSRLERLKQVLDEQNQLSTREDPA